MSEFVSGVDPASFPEPFAGLYRRHLQHLQLKGLRPKAVEAYARAMRRIGTHFDYQVSALSAAQLTDYFTQMKAAHSWSGVKLDLYGGKHRVIYAPRLALRLWAAHGDCVQAYAARLSSPKLPHAAGPSARQNQTVGGHHALTEHRPKRSPNTR
ncbi:MAG: hypothetical protein U5L74_13110 [Ideonella sp.]|nr:hypothetical protein [Ideonella sp.]